MARTVTIADETGYLLLTIDSNINSVAKTGANLSLKGAEFILIAGESEYVFQFSEVTSPVAANAEALRVLIDGYLTESSGVATAVTVAQLPTSVGQKTSAQSLSVVVASDQSPIPISGSITTLASENHIGSVGGNTVVVTSTVVMSVAGAYATGDYMGTTTSPQSFSNAVRVSGGTGIIKSLFISDKITTANVNMELWLFSQTFVAPTDNAAWAISDAEALTVLGVIPIPTVAAAQTGWYASSNNQVYCDATISIPIKLSATSLFYALVARGTTPAFTSLDLTIGLGILQD